MILRYLLIFFSTAAKLLRSESVKCPARAVIAKTRARHVYVMSLNLLTSRKSLGLPMNRYTFILPSENQKAFRLLYICANAVYNVIQSPKDISSIKIFCKDIHESLKYVDELSGLTNDEIQKEHASLSLLVDL